MFPCRPRSKKPATPQGFHDATTDAERVQEWWARRAVYNVAIATGATSGLVVIDVDPRHGGDVTLEALTAEHGPLPKTPTAQTGGGGLHYLFQHPGGYVKGRAGALGPGLDVKADGGYIVAPRSKHPGGGDYRWIVSPDDAPLAALPTWMASMLTIRDADSESSNDDRDGCVSCVSESLSLCASVSLCQWIEKAMAATLPTGPGQRNRRIFTFAQWLKTHPESKDATMGTLRPHVMAWHKAAAANISGEHGPDETWADFIHAWGAVKYPLGAGPLAEALAAADGTDMPACAEQYANETTRRLIRLCRELQRRAGDKPFYLACRPLGDVLGIDHDRANKLLGMLCTDGILERVYKGHSGRASEFRYIGLDNATDTGDN